MSFTRDVVFIVSFPIWYSCNHRRIALINQDYEFSVGAILGYGVGYPLALTGVLSLFLDLVILAITIMESPSKMSDQAHKYWKKQEEWKLRVVPSINFEEPGGGILLQLGF